MTRHTHLNTKIPQTYLFPRAYAYLLKIQNKCGNFFQETFSMTVLFEKKNPEIAKNGQDSKYNRNKCGKIFHETLSMAALFGKKSRKFQERLEAYVFDVH